METHPLFMSADVDRAQVPYPFAYGGEPLVWAGLGYKLHMTDPTDSSVDAIIDIFVVKRDGDETSQIQPLVVRQVLGKGAQDYVVYGRIENSSATVLSYSHEKDIVDIHEYLRGEWPNWQSRLLPPGIGSILALIEAVTGSDEYGSRTNYRTTRHYERLERLPLSSMGTPPLHPAIAR